MTNRSVENPVRNTSIRYKSGTALNISFSAEILRVLSNREALQLRLHEKKYTSEIGLFEYLSTRELEELREYAEFFDDSEIQELYEMWDKTKESLYKAAEIIGNIRVNVDMIYSYELGDFH